MESRKLNQMFLCCLLLVSVLVITEAQNFTAVDVTLHSEIAVMSTEAVTLSWMMTTDCYEYNHDTSSSPWPEYTADQSSSGFQEESERRNITSTTSAVWLWQPVTWSWWVILQMIAALLGIVGNLLVIVLLFQRRRKSRSTDTLVGALATADFFTSIFLIPLPIGVRVPYTLLGELYCKLVFTSIFMWVSVVASILTLTFIPAERYIAVVYPFRCKELLSRRRVVTAIISIWVTGLIVNSFLLFITWVHPTEKRCNLAFPWGGMQQTIGVIIFTIEFLIPALVSLTLHSLTARALHLQSRLHLGADKGLDRSNPAVRHALAKKRVLQTLFIVVVLFVICWGPNQIVYLGFNLRLVPPSYIFSPLYHALNILGFCNSCANPIVYTVRYPEFRKAVRELFNPAQRSDAPLFGDRTSDKQATHKENSNVV